MSGIPLHCLLLSTLCIPLIQGCAPAPELPEDAPRVAFVGLESGDRVASPLVLEFEAKNLAIEPVGDGMIQPGSGHFHLGLNTKCLPPSTPIPTAAPWIHFSDGSNSIDMDLPTGKHRLVLQAGDGAHRTLAGRGLCTEIEILVEAPDPTEPR